MRRPLRVVLVLALLAIGTVSFAPAATADPTSRLCPPSALALHYSDALDKKVVDGAQVGGLSDIAWDARRHAYASTVDNHLSDPARIWFYRGLDDPTVVGPPLVLTQADGTPYTGMTADDEGLAVLPDGDYLVSSEVEPSIRIFGRDGRQKATLPVPARFAVVPAGEATSNATLEGLTIAPDGRHVVAAMEGTLSGDTSDGKTDAGYRRFLVYGHGRSGWALEKQLAYRVDPGNRISEVQLYGRDHLLVMEAAFSPATGNTIELYAVTSARSTPDVSDVANLSAAPAADVMAKALVADVTRCPTLGASAKQPQANPLLDNYEGMTITGVPLGRRYLARVTLISDDNFGATQITRVLQLGALLP